MNLGSWIRKKLFTPEINPFVPSSETQAVMQISREVSRYANQLNEKLRGYADSPDAFTAMFVDSYESQQLAHMTDDQRAIIKRGLKKRVKR